MNQKSFIIASIIIIIISIILIIADFTGQAVIIGDVEGCSDTDGGINKYEKGTTTYENREVAYTDSCYTTMKVKEYYCNPPEASDALIKSMKMPCPNGCERGACNK